VESSTGSASIEYSGQIRAWLRSKPGSSHWTAMKNGFGGVFVAVGPGGSIEIHALIAAGTQPAPDP
jgi:hypothetical protein